MSSHEALDDDYVARLLAEDAKITSRNASGLSTKRRAADAPKPNTRFLTHIVREADHHNAALKQKEEREAHRRLEALREKDHEPPRKRHRVEESDVSRRKRMLGDILGAVQSRSEEKQNGQRRPRSRTEKESSSHRHHRSHQSHPSRSRSRERARERSSRSDRHSDDRARRRRRSRSPESRSQHRASSKREDEYVERRGRGVGKKHHDRLADDYDPALDLSMDSEDDDAGKGIDKDEDWDMALEAMRDRVKYRKNQASRMREAGFDEREISKFESSLLATNHANASLEPDPATVKWSRRGETRAWDAGKEIEESRLQ